MRQLFLIVLLAISTSMMAQQQPQSKTALLIIDVQEFYFVEGKSQLVNPEEASKQAALLLNSFRNNSELIVHIRHASSEDSAIHAHVKPKKDEKVITKQYVNSYRENDLLDYLKKNDITNVVICGMMTHVCVEAAARASADYGFDVTVISDACATRNITYDKDTVLAEDVHNSTLATIQSFYGKIMTTEEYLKSYF